MMTCNNVIGRHNLCGFTLHPQCFKRNSMWTFVYLFCLVYCTLVYCLQHFSRSLPRLFRNCKALKSMDRDGKRVWCNGKSIMQTDCVVIFITITFDLIIGLNLWVVINPDLLCKARESTFFPQWAITGTLHFPEHWLAVSVTLNHIWTFMALVFTLKIEETNLVLN